MNTVAKDYLPLSEQALPIISDIHGNAAGLRQVLAHVKELDIQNPPLVLGDVAWHRHASYDPLGVLELLMDIPLYGVVRGNTDQWLGDGFLEAWQPRTALDQAEKARLMACKERFTSAQVDFLRSLPFELSFQFAGHSMLAVHASPLDITKGLTLDLSPEELARRLDGKAFEYLITGHLHRPYIHCFAGRTHYSVGAVGKHPHEYDGIIDFAILDATASGIVLIHQRLVQQ